MTCFSNYRNCNRNINWNTWMKHRCNVAMIIALHVCVCVSSFFISCIAVAFLHLFTLTYTRVMFCFNPNISAMNSYFFSEEKNHFMRLIFYACSNCNSQICINIWMQFSIHMTPSMQTDSILSRIHFDR